MTPTCTANRRFAAPMRRTTIIALTALLLVSLPAASFGQDLVSRPLKPVANAEKIVNGELTWGAPSVVDIVFLSGNFTLCTGTLIGCQTVLTAAHCVCAGNTFDSCETPDPTDYRIFGQNFGFAEVDSITVNPGFEFGATSDFAIMTLTQPVSGIGPSAINTTGKPAASSQARITGYGITDGNGLDSGLLRTGLVTTVACTNGIPDATNVCWNFDNPIGNPGQDSNTCSGDSGGPLFVDFGAGSVLAGVTSGGFSADCLPADHSFDSDVFGAAAWIQSVAGSDLNNTSCGSLASAGTAGSPILANTEGERTLDASTPQREYTVQTTADVDTLRVTLNGEDEQFNDFDLYVKFGSAPVPPDDFDCRSIEFGTYEECEFSNPSAGTWFLLADRFDGDGEFQISATLLGTNGGGGNGTCNPDTDTVCLLNDRFQAEIDWRDFEGNTGAGRVVTTSDDSGLLYFFGPNNWEFLVKMVDACNSPFNSFWLFSAATTNVEYTLTITDTQTNTVKTYFNPLGNAAAAVTDTMAFSTCP
jgi:hypothetical protein